MLRYRIIPSSFSSFFRFSSPLYISLKISPNFSSLGKMNPTNKILKALPQAGSSPGVNNDPSMVHDNNEEAIVVGSITVPSLEQHKCQMERPPFPLSTKGNSSMLANVNPGKAQLTSLTCLAHEDRSSSLSANHSYEKTQFSKKKGRSDSRCDQNVLDAGFHVSSDSSHIYDKTQVSKRKCRIDLSGQNVIDTGFNSNFSSGFIKNHSSNLGDSITNYESLPDAFSMPTDLGKSSLNGDKRNLHVHNQRINKYSSASANLDSPNWLSRPFNICQHWRIRYTLQTASVQAKAKERSNEFQGNAEATQPRILRPGMVLLKQYLTHNEQVEIVKICRALGLGPGGFYRPCYKDGAKLRLQMMCLGLNWDPQTRKYSKKRSLDDSEAPTIPHKCIQLVERAIQEAHSLIQKETDVGNVEDILPSLSPNICIINFYTTSGRLGLHQDRDESRESLSKGLPVVSFSVGDSAEFLYGDQRDTYKAEKIVLESGDVLIFGGESRHVYHGVSSIIESSAPQELLGETGLRPGRLNLTFRQF